MNLRCGHLTAVDSARLDRLATGEIFTATQAKEFGLVDELGFIEDAIARAAELADLGDDSYRVVQFKSPMTILDVFGSVQSQSETSMPWQTLLDMSAPKAYYLFSALPALANQATCH